jgi:KEOPS complex subunit Pcc1
VIALALRAKTVVRLKFKDERKMQTAFDALGPEMAAPVTRRANVSMHRQGVFLVLAVEAEDTVALRATLNAFLRWIASALNVVELIEHL